jgi:hypothetical protein
MTLKEWMDKKRAEDEEVGYARPDDEENPAEFLQVE